MPHFQIEYSANLAGFDPAAALETCHRALLASGQFGPHDIKGRAIRLDVFRIGDGEAGGFIQARLNLLSGRTPEVRKALADALLAALQAQAPALRPLQITAETVDMERPLYAKAVLTD